MKKILSQIKQRHWDTLSASEQKTIKRGSFILIPMLMYGLLWQPAHQYLPKLQAELPRIRAQVAQMQQLAQQVQTLRLHAQPAVLDAIALQSLVEQSVRASGLPLEVAPGEQNRVRIHTESISFEQWLNWIRELEKVQHLRIAGATLVATEPGKVSVQAVLANGAD
jgi:general secretion pathway protein M